MLKNLFRRESHFNNPGWVATDYGIRRHVFCHDTSSGNNGAPSYLERAEKNGAMPDPNIVFQRDGGRVIPSGVPDCFSDTIEAVIAPVEERDMVRNQDVVPEDRIDLEKTVGANADMISDNRPVTAAHTKLRAQLAMDIPAGFNPRVPDPEDPDISKRVEQ